jgi:hypothetical protein
MTVGHDVGAAVIGAGSVSASSPTSSSRLAAMTRPSSTDCAVKTASW